MANLIDPTKRHRAKAQHRSRMSALPNRSKSDDSMLYLRRDVMIALSSRSLRFWFALTITAAIAINFLEIQASPPHRELGSPIKSFIRSSASRYEESQRKKVEEGESSPVVLDSDILEDENALRQLKQRYLKNTTTSLVDDSTKEKKSEEKPRFILHIGPLKTGTTTIQQDLHGMMHRGFLEADNWHFAKNDHTLKNGLHLDKLPSNLDFQAFDFFDKFKQHMDRFRKLNMNVVFSCENYSIAFGRNPRMFEELKDLLQDDWNVEIVSGYRPFHDWMFSMWGQVNKRNDQIYKDAADWPWSEPPHDGGRIHWVQPFYPKLHSWLYEDPVFTDAMVELATPYFPVTVLDMREKKGLRTAFLCDIMKAPISCFESIRRDREEPATRENTGSTDMIRCDSIGLEAAKRGLVNTKDWKRADVQQVVMQYVEKELNKKILDLPFKCPEASVLEELLDKSLALDEKYGPYPSPDSVRKSFAKKVESKAFCAVDLDVIFEQPEWLSFFANLSGADLIDVAAANEKDVPEVVGPVEQTASSTENVPVKDQRPTLDSQGSNHGRNTLPATASETEEGTELQQQKDSISKFIDSQANELAVEVADTTKPRFVLHLGPLKTGTTSVQEDLDGLQWRHFLEADNWHYAKVDHTLKNGDQVKGITKEDIEGPGYLDDFKRQLDAYRKLNTNVIYSNENMSCVFGRRPWMFEKLKELLQDDWDVEIVSGYRPYHDFVASMWTQVNKRNDWIYFDPGDDWPWSEPEDRGEIHQMQPFFPKLYGWLSRDPVFTDTMVESAKPHFPVTVMDLRDPKGLLTIVLCDIMKASSACQESLRRAEEDKRNFSNKGSKELNHYDSIGLEAARKGLVDTEKMKRIDVQHAVKQYVEDELKIKWSDLPFICPETSDLDHFLERSLAMEAKYAPSPSAESIRESFAKQNAKKTFCTIDYSVLLEQKEWLNFFDKLSGSAQQQ